MKVTKTMINKVTTAVCMNKDVTGAGINIIDLLRCDYNANGKNSALYQLVKAAIEIPNEPNGGASD